MWRRKRIILASGSPRRKELLRHMKIPFRAITPRIDERVFDESNIESLVRQLAAAKVEAILPLVPEKKHRWIVGMDTLVDIEGAIVGKPRGIEEARATLKSLSGKTHRVVTGLALLAGSEYRIRSEACTTHVTFRAMTAEELSYYLSTDEWRGAAGGYRIQDRGAYFVRSIEGSYSNVVGLPLSLFYVMLRSAGYIFM